VGLRFDPIGGGQFKQALKTIIEVERQPIQNLEVRKQREEARMKLFQEFKGKFSGMDKALAEFSNFNKFRELKVDLGDGQNYVGVTLDKDRAEPGTYTIQVDQLAKKSSIISNGFEDPDEQLLGVGFVVVYLRNGESKEVFIDSDHASLRGVAEMINREKDSPIRASVIRDLAEPDAPWKLILSGKKDGFDDHVEFPEFYFLDGAQDIYIDDESEAQNALITLDGFPIEAESNAIKDFVTGVNLHLKQARPDQPFTITITEDYQKISGKVKGMIDQINGILDFINKQNKVDEKSDTRTTFAGDTSLQTIEYRLRNLLHEGFPVGDPEGEDFRFVFLSEIGVEFGKDGLLAFKEEKFQKLMETDFSGIAEMITGEYGFASQLRAVIGSYSRVPDGLLGVREAGLRSRIRKLDDDIAQKERRLEQRSQALTEKFSRLQASLGNLQKQQQYLSATLPGGGGGNLVSQLLGG
jgi:flagellar hook-associated protein 2